MRLPAETRIHHRPCRLRRSVLPPRRVSTSSPGRQRARCRRCVGYAEAVVNPCCGNIGGGGFMVAHLPDGRDIFLNFRETAPAAATPRHVSRCRRPAGSRRQSAWLESGRGPGHGAGSRHRTGEIRHLAARDRHGSRHPAGARRLRADRCGRRHPCPGRRIAAPRPDRGAHLPASRRIAATGRATVCASRNSPRPCKLSPITGPDAFYKGSIPQAVEAASRAGGGIITAADFAAYRVTETAPAELHLSRLRRHVRAATLFGRRDDLRDPEHPGRLRPARHGLSRRRIRASDDRGFAAGVFRPQHLPRRSGFRACSADAPVVKGLRRAVCAARSATAPRLGQSRSGGSAAGRKAGDDAFFGPRQGGRRGRRHLHDQRRVSAQA